MPELLGRVLPLPFRILYRQFLLRVVDLESLSMHADIPRYLGQFAGVLIMLSLIQAGEALLSGADRAIPEVRLMIAWRAEQWLLSTMMLIVGLAVAFLWDSTFPDRRDAMVLAPLPVKMRTIVAAKVAAVVSILAIAVAAFNVGSGIAWPLVLGDAGGFLRLLTAYWFAMLAASLFLYASVLTVQGIAALLLPRRIFLWLSALLQMATFASVIGFYFLQPVIDSPAGFAATENQRILAVSPIFWFFGLLNQMNGSLPQTLAWLPRRAWMALAIAMTGAVVSLLLCYLRTIKKTIEEPDLVPGRGRFLARLRFGGELNTAILFFTLRSLVRSRQHRLAFTFYLAMVFALTIVLLLPRAPDSTHGAIHVVFVCASFLAVGFSVVGLRKVFALPVWLGANWVFRITRLRPAAEYLKAVRRSLLLLGVFPVWCIASLISLRFRPLSQVAVHLVVLAILGTIACDLSLIGFRKVPFTCSYLPGQANVQFVFWGMVIVVLPLLMLGAMMELQMLQTPRKCALMVTVLLTVSIGLWVMNSYRARSASLAFEEVPLEEIISLGLTAVPAAAKEMELTAPSLSESRGGVSS